MKLTHVYYLIMWKEVSPYARFIDVSATRQKIAMELNRRGFVTLEPFITVTDKGNKFLELVEVHADIMANSNG